MAQVKQTRTYFFFVKINKNTDTENRNGVNLFFKTGIVFCLLDT